MRLPAALLWVLCACPAFAVEPLPVDAPSNATPSVVLTPAQLAEYAGVYPLLATVFLKIFTENDRLMAQVLGQPAFPLSADGEDIFSAPAYQIEIKFERDSAARVIGLGLLQAGMELKAQKMAETPAGG